MSASSSTLVPPLMMREEEEPRNWTELPSEVTSLILLRLGAVEILENAQKVCKPWRHICKDPSMWQKIDMRDLGNRRLKDLDFDTLCRHAVDLSQGGLLEINLEYFSSDSLLAYIADRSRNLRSLGIQMFFTPITNGGLVNAIAKLPLLETLEVSHTCFRLNLKAIGHACPQLKTLKLNSSGSGFNGFDEFDELGNYSPIHVKGDDDYALAIAESMPKLRHLQLLGDRLTETGLNAILDGCPHLEHLDLRKCYNIKLVGNLEKQCLERIKEFKGPDDSTADYPYDITFVNSDFDDSYFDYYDSDSDIVANYD
ncbi:PREDICTED: putative F-box/LRR-repeat protein 21 [Camelina sativa]|uniref:F-box/LRR-repeat protein 21 n=1 Tax=Camelina sativa TaxID=90675 RepID=A0ABM0TU08_CAMSA|nr:PREDICTED: putative F-box/LRR-repeat protein 21 [Camelina sativa]